VTTALEDAAGRRGEKGEGVALRAVVVGGGIGGIAAAVALRRAGFDVRVYEQAQQLAEVGAGVSLAPNGLRMLYRLGAGEGIARLGARHARTQLLLSDGQPARHDAHVGRREKAFPGLPGAGRTTAELRRIRPVRHVGAGVMVGARRPCRASRTLRRPSVDLRLRRVGRGYRGHLDHEIFGVRVSQKEFLQTAYGAVRDT